MIEWKHNWECFMKSGIHHKPTTRLIQIAYDVSHLTNLFRSRPDIYSLNGTGVK